MSEKTESWIDWSSIKITRSKSYHSSRRAKTRDRIKVELEMPSEVFRKLRRQIEAPGSFGHRRKDDAAT